jgi:hypothetical protein
MVADPMAFAEGSLDIGRIALIKVATNYEKGSWHLQLPQ